MPGLAADFSGFAPDAFASAPALSRCLSRAQRQAWECRTAQQAALALFGVETTDSEFPIAAIRYLGDCGRCPQAWCMNADPVHLRADTRGLLLFDAASLSITAEEATALGDSLKPVLDADGWTLEVATPDHWYLSGSVAVDLQTTPLPQVRGQPVGSFLPRGSASGEWLSRMNELQMLLHTHPVNRERAVRGAPAINSLWLWGGGTLPLARASCFDSVCSDDSFIRGLALWNNADIIDAVNSAHELLARLHGGGRLLLVLDSFQRAADYADLDTWNKILEGCERDWFAPLLHALAQRRVCRIELFPLNGYRYRLRSHDLWRVWRRTSSYRELLCTGAS